MVSSLSRSSLRYHRSEGPPSIRRPFTSHRNATVLPSSHTCSETDAPAPSTMAIDTSVKKVVGFYKTPQLCVILIHD